jgi:hypothetical protein
MVDDDVFKEFEVWFCADTGGDPDFLGHTAQQWLHWAESHARLDELLSLAK